MTMIKNSITATARQGAWLNSLIYKDFYASDSGTAQREIIREALIEAEKALETKGYSEKAVKAIMEEVLERKGLNAQL